MSNRTDAALLRDIYDAANETLFFCMDMQRADFDVDTRTQKAVILNFAIIGEAANKVSPETKLRLSTIPWSDLISMRNRVIHGYSSVNLAVIWLTVHEDLPLLIVQLEREFAG